MMTSMDLLIIVAMMLIAASMVAMVLMFLVRNKTVKRVSFYLVAGLSIYMGCVGFYILWPEFMGQSVIALMTILAGIGVIVLERLSKDNSKRLLFAQVLGSVALIIAIFNVFVL